MNVAASAVSAAISVAAMIYNQLPWYLIVPIVLFMFSVCLHLFAGIMKALAVRGVRKISLDAVADACECFEERYWSFQDAHQNDLRAISEIEMRRWDNGGQSMMEVIEQARRLEDELMRKMKARLGSDVGALVAMFKSLGIEADSDFRSLHWSDGQARYYGAVGKLLRNGLLDEARKLKRTDLFF